MWRGGLSVGFHVISMSSFEEACVISPASNTEPGFCSPRHRVGCLLFLLLPCRHPASPQKASEPPDSTPHPIPWHEVDSCNNLWRCPIRFDAQPSFQKTTQTPERRYLLYPFVLLLVLPHSLHPSVCSETTVTLAFGGNFSEQTVSEQKKRGCCCWNLGRSTFLVASLPCSFAALPRQRPRGRVAVERLRPRRLRSEARDVIPSSQWVERTNFRSSHFHEVERPFQREANKLRLMSNPLRK